MAKLTRHKVQPVYKGGDLLSMRTIDDTDEDLFHDAADEERQAISKYWTMVSEDLEEGYL